MGLLCKLIEPAKPVTGKRKEMHATAGSQSNAAAAASEESAPKRART